MTDRANGIVVVLDHDTRVDDLECIINAIELINGVVCAKANIADPDSFIVRERVISEMRRKIFDALK
jgi:hypothetical protein